MSLPTETPPDEYRRIPGSEPRGVPPEAFEQETEFKPYEGAPNLGNVGRNVRGSCIGEFEGAACQLQQSLDDNSRPCYSIAASCARFRRLDAILAAMPSGTKQKLEWVEDSKGELTICWCVLPQVEDRRCLENLWEEVGEEASEHVEHVMRHK